MTTAVGTDGADHAPVIAVCMKWTLEPSAAASSSASAPSTSTSTDDDRFAGVSPADRAALEVALRLASTWRATVVAVAAGPAAADRILRDAVAAGADRAIRLEMATGAESRDVAFELAQVVASADVVLCGDYSLDRGSGSVPAIVAHHARFAQALGLVDVSVDVEPPLTGPSRSTTSTTSTTSIRAVRRLDGGRREVLDVGVPCVLSVEGSVASLRRAPLRRALASRSAPIEVVATPPAHHQGAPAIITPYRPRARVVPTPRDDDVLARLRRLTDAGGSPGRGETVELEPAAAAARIIESLRAWGYLAGADADTPPALA